MNERSRYLLTVENPDIKADNSNCIWLYLNETELAFVNYIRSLLDQEASCWSFPMTSLNLELLDTPEDMKKSKDAEDFRLWLKLCHSPEKHDSALAEISTPDEYVAACRACDIEGTEVPCTYISQSPVRGEKIYTRDVNGEDLT